MTNNAPDYEDNLAFEPAKTAGTIEMVTKDGKAVAIRCYIDNQHYFDLALEDAPEKMDWFNAKVWCEEHYCRLPMKRWRQDVERHLLVFLGVLKRLRVGCGP